MARILIVDDDLHIGNLLEEALSREGYLVSRAYSGTEALLAVSAYRPDLVLLDLMLPGMSGGEILPRLAGTPVIVVSARADVQDKVELLMNGAADYVTKPFDIKELLARIVVCLRNAPSLGGQLLRFADLCMDERQHSVTAAETDVRLTRTEYAILKILMQNSTQVVTKTVLLDRISLDTPDCSEGSLKMHVSNLRRKLRDVSGKDYIEAVWGIGFRLRSADID